MGLFRLRNEPQSPHGPPAKGRPQRAVPMWFRQKAQKMLWGVAPFEAVQAAISIVYAAASTSATSLRTNGINSAPYCWASGSGS